MRKAGDRQRRSSPLAPAMAISPLKLRSARKLPLISYGGSSGLTVMLALGLGMNVSVRRFAY